MLYRLSGNASDAEDLLQETFLVVWRKRDSFEGRGAPEGFLRKTAVRQFLSQDRTRRRRADRLRPQPAFDLEAGIGDDPAESDYERRDALDFLAARVREAVDALPEGQRETFLLFRYEELSCVQIAEATGAPLKTVETRLWRATRELARRLGPLRVHLPAS